MRFTLFVLPLGALLSGCGDDTDDTAGMDTDVMDTDVMDVTCPVDLCATYGAAVPAVASEVTNRAAADPQFSADFAPLVAEGEAAVTAFKGSLTNFISDAYGCSTDLYTGPSMEASHAGLNITQAEYDAFIGLIAGVLVDSNVPQNHIDDCFAPPLVDPAFAAKFIGK